MIKGECILKPGWAEQSPLSLFDYIINSRQFHFSNDVYLQPDFTNGWTINRFNSTKRECDHLVCVQRWLLCSTSEVYKSTGADLSGYEL